MSDDQRLPGWPKSILPLWDGGARAHFSMSDILRDILREPAMPLGRLSPGQGKSEMLPTLSSTPPTLLSRPASTIEVWGHWRGKSGSILSIRKAPGRSHAIRVEGEALDQKVRGEGSIDGDKITIRLELLTERKELDLDLQIEEKYGSDLLSGSCRDCDGVVRDVHLRRWAPVGRQRNIPVIFRRKSGLA
jgi:hypothetical protein